MAQVCFCNRNISSLWEEVIKRDRTINISTGNSVGGTSKQTTKYATQRLNNRLINRRNSATVPFCLKRNVLIGLCRRFPQLKARSNWHFLVGNKTRMCSGKDMNVF